MGWSKWLRFLLLLIPAPLRRRVLNLDYLDDDQRQTTLAMAAINKFQICVAATVRIPACSEMPDAEPVFVERMMLGTAASLYFGYGGERLPEEVREFLEGERAAQNRRAFRVSYREFSEEREK